MNYECELMHGVKI